MPSELRYIFLGTDDVERALRACARRLSTDLPAGKLSRIRLVTTPEPAFLFSFEGAERNHHMAPDVLTGIILVYARSLRIPIPKSHGKRLELCGNTLVLILSNGITPPPASLICRAVRASA